ncbi:hypothetical protein BDW02DRAFT_484978, partial [Decorospora gaudefroyi]
IRILYLCAGVGDEPLRGSLNHAELDATNHEYLALSYVWGVPKYERPLLLPEGRLYLTENLEQALKRIRRPTESLHVWADAVYINQDDVHERGHQVNLMGQIYKSARRVIIWLGPDPTGSAPAAFEYLKY